VSDWITCGIDVGSLTTKAVLLAGDNILGYTLIPTGPHSAETALAAFENLLCKAQVDRKNISFTVATGYGRVIVPFSDANISEISCHAKGAHYFFSGVRTLLDMGGQDCKAIRCDGEGKVIRFLMNDKCAAGTGRAIEVMASLLQVPLEEVGPRSLQSGGEAIKISNTCVVFARSEVLSLARQGVPSNQILAGVCEAIADRARTLVDQVGLEKDFVITGGICKNSGIVRRLEKKLKVAAHISFEPQIVGAVGAALFAMALKPRKP
jgi:predicted CoA-substrate-specific enzyme activase